MPSMNDDAKLRDGPDGTPTGPIGHFPQRVKIIVKEGDWTNIELLVGNHPKGWVPSDAISADDGGIIDPFSEKEFADLCLVQALACQVNSHYMLAVAKLRSNLKADNDGDKRGPFRLLQAEWDANLTDPDLGWHFNPNDIDDWDAHPAIFALMARRAEKKFNQTTPDRRPMPLELYKIQWPNEPDAGLAAKLETAFKDTTDLEIDSEKRILDLVADPSTPGQPPTSSGQFGGEPPAAGGVSQRAFDLIVEFEVSSKQVYERKYRKPIWPGEQSGVTVGIGYDVGYASVAQLQSDWNGVISDAMITALKTAIGVKGAAASPLAANLGASVDIPWDAAIRVHAQKVMPRWVTVVKNALPHFDNLGPDRRGALVSLAYNRGPSFSNAGDRYKEMRAIKAHMTNSDFAKIPGEIRAMKRLWPNSAGLRSRRDREAKMFEDNQ